MATKLMLTGSVTLSGSRTCCRISIAGSRVAMKKHGVRAQGPDCTVWGADVGLLVVGASGIAKVLWTGPRSRRPKPCFQTQGGSCFYKLLEGC